MPANVEVMKVLLGVGLDEVAATPDAKGLTPLHYACGSGDVEGVRCLLEAKANIEVQDPMGQTPMHRAAIAKQPECLRPCLDVLATYARAARARVDARPRRGRSRGPLSSSSAGTRRASTRRARSCGSTPTCSPAPASPPRSRRPTRSAPATATAAPSPPRWLRRCGATQRRIATLASRRRRAGSFPTPPRGRACSRVRRPKR